MGSYDGFWNSQARGIPAPPRGRASARPARHIMPREPRIMYDSAGRQRAPATLQNIISPTSVAIRFWQPLEKGERWATSVCLTGLPPDPPAVCRARDVLQALTEFATTRSRPASRLSATPGFGTWLGARAGFFAVSTLTSEMLLFITGNGAGGVSAGARNFGFTRGVSADRARMWVAGTTRLFHLVNQGPRTVGAVDHDAVYVPQRAYFVGDGLLHDVVHAVILGGERNEVVFVNTSYSVIATVDQDHSFRPLWKPKHISRLVPEDRCHLNCVGLRGDRVTYASMFSLTDTAQGWREAGPGSGVIVDIASHEVVCAGLQKPHSLRWHRDRLWVLDSRAGDFGYVDEQRGRFVVVKHLGNYLRGLVMIGDYAVIGATAVRGEPLKHDPSIPGLSTQPDHCMRRQSTSSICARGESFTP